MVERFNENAGLDYTELKAFIPELQDLHWEVEREIEPEQVRDLTEKEFYKLIDKDTLTKDEMKSVVKYANENDHDSLYLWLTSLDAETAKALAEFEWRELYFGLLTSLDVDTARALAEFKWIWISLNSLTSLDAETARALAEFEWKLFDLDWLTSLDVETARALAGFKWDVLSLNWLTSLDVEIARELAQFRWSNLHLFRVTNISDEVVEILIPIKSKIVSLELDNRIKEVELRDEIWKKTNKDLWILQQKIEGTRKKIDWKWERWNLEFDWSSRSIKSWWNAVKVAEREFYMREQPERIILEWLDLPLYLEEWVWLANFKNRFKHSYPGQKVEYKTDIKNKKFMNFWKTFVVKDKTLVARRDLPVYRNDKEMEKIAEWLNN